MRRILKNPESGDTPYLFLGYASLLAGFLTIFIKSGYVKSLPFFATGIAVLLLSMGPPALVFKYFSKLPFMSFIDCPQRFTIGVQLALAALIGILISLIKIKNKIVRIILLLIFLTIFMIEYGTTGLPLTKLTIPYVYKTVAAQENDLTVLELPSGLTESKGAFGYDWSIWGLNSMQMYWQTIHRKPKVGGYVSRIDDNTYSFFKNEPVISDLLTMVSLGGEWNGKSFSQTQIEAFIKNFNLGYIILSPNARQSEFARVIEDLFYLRISEKITKEGYVLYILIKN